MYWEPLCLAHWVSRHNCFCKLNLVHQFQGWELDPKHYWTWYFSVGTRMNHCCVWKSCLHTIMSYRHILLLVGNSNKTMRGNEHIQMQWLVEKRFEEEHKENERKQLEWKRKGCGIFEELMMRVESWYSTKIKYSFLNIEFQKHLIWNYITFM